MMIKKMKKLKIKETFKMKVVISRENYPIKLKLRKMYQKQVVKRLMKREQIQIASLISQMMNVKQNQILQILRFWKIVQDQKQKKQKRLSNYNFSNSQLNCKNSNLLSKMFILMEIVCLEQFPISLQVLSRTIFNEGKE